jgi:hypothetical protein
MKKMIFFSLIVVVSFSCTPLKHAQTSIARGIAGSSVIKVSGHEVYCSQGQVCSEVEVLEITPVEKTKAVNVVLKNRTDHNAVVKIVVQMIEPDGTKTETRAELISIPPTELKTYTLTSLYKKDAKYRVLLNAAR